MLVLVDLSTADSSLLNSEELYELQEYVLMFVTPERAKELGVSVLCTVEED